ncbi:MAG TPA: TRAFs-binding domain-containing protein [Thermoanaerobaculia bacterium]|nr:TRAFs-binding domain-containing protein [Thermoanaerobaculia bacterium]
MMSALDEWLAHAPSPRSLRSDQRWHVFLSYRSVHRPWVIQLYDVLRHLGFEVFLDQYALSSADSLVGGLEEALEQSAGGILVWSSQTEDSPWCTKEYRSMEHRQLTDPQFHYAVAKLDGVMLPLFAQQKLYVDFSGDREGPRGTGLLRLLYGLLGQTLPDGAVRLAVRMDEATKEALAAIQGARTAGNVQSLLEMASSEGLAWQSSPILGCQVAEALIALKQPESALQVLAGLRARFPKSIRPRQLEGLALARLGDWRKAQEILESLVAAGEQDPETLGICGRTWMDRFHESKNVLHLRKSRDLYAQAFRNAPRDYYTGINAASKSVLLGDIEAAQGFATKVEEIVGTEIRFGDYWWTATVAEVQLIQKNYKKAARLYEAAVAMAPEERANHESTWLQAKRLMEKLESAPEPRSLVAQAFVHLGDVTP